MPGVNPPNSEQLQQFLANLHNRLRALETQQQLTISGSNGQPVVNLGLVPGSNPAEYGLQLVDPTTENVVAFLGEDSSGDAVFNVTGTETVTGTLNVTGNMVVGGNLSVPNGSITNAALSNPVIPSSGIASGSNYSLPVISTFGQGGGGTTRATVTLTVPTGCTSAVILAVAQDAAYNSTAATDTLYSFIDVVGLSWFTAPSADVPSHAWAASITNDYKFVSGLTPGGTITVNSKPGTLNAAWATNVNNTTSLDVVALFLR